MIRLTAAQSSKVNASIKTSCANCDSDGNCLLLEGNCPQMQSYNLLCIYYRDNVLPTNKDLYAELSGKSETVKHCIKCGKIIQAKSNRTKYCSKCSVHSVREASRKRQQKRRSNVTL